MKDEIKIEDIAIGSMHEPFVIAEMSGNHNNDIEQAMKLIEEAHKAGAHAIKIQTYTADTMTIRSNSNDFLIDDKESLWFGSTLYDLYEKAHTPWEWHETIFDKCRSLGILCFSTPFDITAVDFLEKLETPAYKIASFENTDLTLIKKIAELDKPIFLSAGMATVAELDDSIETIRNEGSENIVLLKCTSSYPAPPEKANLKTIPHMRDLYQINVGISDHTRGIGVAVASVALGATVIEKHLTLSRSESTVDSEFSLEPHELKNLVTESKRAWKALGGIQYGCDEDERKSLKFRRSLYIVKDMRKGDCFDTTNLRAIRPGFGLPIKYYNMLMGKRVRKEVPKGTPMTWDLLG